MWRMFRNPIVGAFLCPFPFNIKASTLGCKSIEITSQKDNYCRVKALQLEYRRNEIKRHRLFPYIYNKV